MLLAVCEETIAELKALDDRRDKELLALLETLCGELHSMLRRDERFANRARPG
jgi:hypothetical protein